ncbi:aspartate--ammonia ligase [Treponema phagedenis]|uniref:Aspartate--ammonia ligase n=1 Tax=Treponema phagedenis TaxID=162 RepID=A0A0B7GVR0_TREPH|nr:aspartate--ammonia ligase [Treponema phagedenis]QEJ94901.1 aspartate--ammonia ligase [Treponema phagedenis]QSH95375.1 aspartate--ammonia ligase [Treponema phagedenis]QSH99853.1 aspartate--ammonia ligase [Treponema phagedenis]CEM62578.1 Aspartate--ammonia ligase [Treponema phagedenis]
MSKLKLPKNYQPILSIKETEQAIIKIKNFFQISLSTELNLTRVTAPLFIPQGKGLNDDLTGIERPVSFPVKDMNDERLEIVHSLAKWKRVKIAEMKLKTGFGIYTDMNAIRADEELDNIHSLYVDQWDWECSMPEENRTLEFLKTEVKKIYYCLKRTEFFLYDNYPNLEPRLPEKITFIHAEDLYSLYPKLTAKEREHKIAEEYGAVFIIGIGAPLANGEPHDGRAPDYDDWITETGAGKRGLNGDLLVWNPVLQESLELSSMGIRVSPETMKAQLSFRNALERSSLYFHTLLLNNKLPQTIGGGIGQSRLCMFFLRKAHIGETQVSVWPDDMIRKCSEHNIPLL